jgi:RNA polymerase sigma-70 factor (TIGR02943 family)
MLSMALLDPGLLDRLRSRDPKVLAATVGEHARPLFRAARGMGFPEQEAEDLVQEVFMTFLETIDRFEGRSQLSTWLFGILHRKAWERRRDLARQEQNDPIDAAFESRFDPQGNWLRPPADLQRLMESKEIGEVIGGCLDALPATQREVFMLREMHDMETPEICKILSITATNMSVLLHRARIRLRECVESRGWRGQ